MAVFPDDEVADSTARSVDADGTDLQETEGGGYQAYLYFPVIRWRWRVRWSIATRQFAWGTLRAFWEAQRASVFTFFEFDYLPLVGAAVGVGDGIETVFDLPCRATVGAVIYVDGVPTAGTLNDGTGPYGSDQFTFGSPPADEAVITMDATEAQGRHRVRFAPHGFQEPQHTEADLWAVEVELVREVTQ